MLGGSKSSWNLQKLTVIRTQMLGFKPLKGLPWWLSGKESTCQCRRHRFDPWVGKIPWRRKWPRTLVLLLGKSHGQRGLVATVYGVVKNWTRLKWLNNNNHRKHLLFPDYGGIRDQSRVLVEIKCQYETTDALGWEGATYVSIWCQTKYCKYIVEIDFLMYIWEISP